MSSYPHIVTVLDRLLAAGIARHHAERHVRYGRVTLNGETTYDPYRAADPPAAVAVRTTSTTEVPA